MKKILLLLVAFLAFNFANAQIDFGIRAGLNYNMPDIKSATITDLKPENKTGWHAGAMLRVKVPLIGLYVEGAPTFTRHLAAASDPSGESNTITTNRFDLPVLLGFQLFGTARIYAGPMASWNLGSKISTATFQEVAADKKMAYGYQAGVGLDVFGIMLDLRYEGAITHSLLLKAAGVPMDIPLDNGGNQILLSVGYKF